MAAARSRLALALALALAGCSDPEPRGGSAAGARREPERARGEAHIEEECGFAREAARAEQEPDPFDQPSEGEGPAYVAKGPAPFRNQRAARLGERIADPALRDVSGRELRLSDLRRGARAVVVLLSNLGCPVTRAYAPHLADVVARWSPRGVRFLVLAPAASEDDAAWRARALELGWSFPVARDPAHALAASLGARRSADAFLLDPEGRLRYRGPIDDRYGIGYRRDEPTRRHLEDALEALLAGRAIAAPAFHAPGCALTPPPRPR